MEGGGFRDGLALAVHFGCFDVLGLFWRTGGVEDTVGLDLEHVTRVEEISGVGHLKVLLAGNWIVEISRPYFLAIDLDASV